MDIVDVILPIVGVVAALLIIAWDIRREARAVRTPALDGASGPSLQSSRDFLVTYPEQIRVYRDIAEERLSQDQKWGPVKDGRFDLRSLHKWNTILIEEVGELAEEILDSEHQNCYTDNLRIEAIQVAAVASAMIEHIDRSQDVDRTACTTNI